LLDTLDVVVDVGGVYDPQKLRFDHHQIGFTGTLDENHTTKLSSAGLVYKHFGREIIHDILGTNSQDTEVIFLKVYKNLIESIDAIDNGIDQYPLDMTPKYQIHTSLGSRVGRLNPWWNDANPKYDEKFKLAIEITGQEFMSFVEMFGKCWLPARSLVVDAINSRFDIDPSGEIILLQHFCPWKEHLYSLETEMHVKVPIKYSLYEDSNGGWRVQCVSLKEGSFENRLSLPWKGLRNEDLSKASEIPGGIFVHIGGFIGGNKTKEGALQMAQKALILGRIQ